MNKFDLKIVTALGLVSIAVVLFFNVMPMVFKPEPIKMTYEEWVKDTRIAIEKYRIKRVSIAHISSDKGGLSIGYNGCIYYHEKFIGCDRQIAKSIYDEWRPIFEAYYKK